MTDPKIQQSGWRLGHPWCGLLDIGTHIADLVSFILDSDIVSVRNGRLGTAGQHGYECFDNGICELVFANGVVAESQFHQALKGHQDDIGVRITLEDGAHLMWRLEWGPDCLYRSESNGIIDDRGQWERILRGTEFFGDKINSVFGITPPGHFLGWPSLWVVLFNAIAGLIHRDRKAWTNKETHGTLLNLPVPRIDMDANQSTRYIEAHVKSAEQDGAEVTLASIA